MSLEIFQVDAFTKNAFGGNPAAVCPLDTWLPDETMQQIAAENNLAETAFFVKNGDRYDIRWFTPTVEVNLCGHATLASAHALLPYCPRLGASVKSEMENLDGIELVAHRPRASRFLAVVWDR